jgi:hypothetical protein
MVELLTITAKAFFWFLDIGGIGDHHSLNFLLPISTKQKKVLSLMVTNYSNINKPKESLSNRDGKQFLQYQQNKRKFIKHFSTIIVKTFFWFVDIGGIVDHHCLYFLFIC